MPHSRPATAASSTIVGSSRVAGEPGLTPSRVHRVMTVTSRITVSTTAPDTGATVDCQTPTVSLRLMTKNRAAATQVPIINSSTPIAATLDSQVNRAVNGSAPATRNTATTTRAIADCSSDPAVGAPARVPTPTRPKIGGSTRSRASPNT